MGRQAAHAMFATGQSRSCLSLLGEFERIIARREILVCSVISKWTADAYRFLGWDYMAMPIDACSKHEVEVEFVDSRGKNVSHVKFTFQAGRVVSADGWMRSFESGPLGERMPCSRMSASAESGHASVCSASSSASSTSTPK